MNKGFVGLLTNSDGVVLFAHGDGNIVGGAHHDAFNYCLTSYRKINFWSVVSRDDPVQDEKVCFCQSVHFWLLGSGSYFRLGGDESKN